jgi:hypothetical protein
MNKDNFGEGTAMSPKQKTTLWVAVIIVIVGTSVAALVAVRMRRREHPLTVRGAIVKEDKDSKNQSPIAGVVVSAIGGVAVGETKSDFSGYFILRMQPWMDAGDPVTLSFRDPDYQPFALQAIVDSNLYVVRLVPIHGEVEAELNESEINVANILVRYTIESTTTDNIGTGVKTFEVANTGNVPCDKRPPCSPDGHWKAVVGGADLDAGEGNVFTNARVTCIAGPCPFTRIDSDNFSDGGRTIKVTMLNWSDPATFLLQAEVFHTALTDIVRESYPVVFGRAMNFTLPAGAEGPSIEAELNGSRIVFPLASVPILSWANCDVQTEKNQAKDYRCELKPQYQFK